ncbi:MAG: hypothetical protein ACLRMJ_08805 [Alistipes finegoldii]
MAPGSLGARPALRQAAQNTDAYTLRGRPPRRRKADRFIWIAPDRRGPAVAAIAFGHLREAKDRETEMRNLNSLPTPIPRRPAMRHNQNNPLRNK